MSPSLQFDLSRGVCQRFLGRRALALAVIALFLFPLSRFYLVIELDKLVCLVPDHQHAAASPGAHSHDQEAAEILSRGDTNGLFLDHCKDTYDGIGLTPVQPMGLAVAAFPPQPESAWASPLKESHQALENFLPPPFQPPRSLS